jgi:aminoglycoside phosphotransferase (APT) family kinase protein
VPELGQRVVESHGISDPGIPTLPEVFDPVTWRKHFYQALPADWGAIQNIRFQILKHHPGKRCTFEIALETANGWRYLIGKVYATDRSDVYRAMDEIRRAGFGPEEEFSIPEPLAYVPELRLLLQEKVRGPRAKEVFLTGDESDRAVAAVRSARWLAKFHSVAPRSWRTTDLTDHVNSADRWSQTIAKLGEPFAGQARRLAKRLQEEEAAFANGREFCAGHGSYNCNQIILTDDRTITLDWDSYDVADPCRDVARFIVNLQRLALKYLGSFQALDAAAEAFLKTYTALRPFEITANLSLYRALICLKLAKYEANRPVCTFPEGIEALLHEGLRVLEREAGKHDGKIG